MIKKDRLDRKCCGSYEPHQHYVVTEGATPLSETEIGLLDVVDSSKCQPTEGKDMARETVIKYLSDLTGEEGANTTNFGLDGTEYEIDLTEKEDKAFRKALDKYLSAARKVSGRRGRKPGAASTGRTSGTNTKAVREWARNQGHQLSDRGRVPQDIQDRYNEAHPS